MVLERIKQLQESLPELIDQNHNPKKEIFKMEKGLLPSLTTVLLQELVKFNRLLSTIRASLAELDDAIHGFTVMSEVLDLMFVSIQNG